MYSKILMPVDGSLCSEQVVAQGLDLAVQVGASVTFLYVVEDPFSYVPDATVAYARVYDDMQQAGEQVLREFEERALRRGVPAQSRLVTGALAHPVEAIVEAANEFDLVFMGTHGRRGFDRWFLGSVTEGVLRRSVRPHLIVRCEGESERDESEPSDR